MLLFLKKGIGNHIFLAGAPILFNIKFGKYFYPAHLVGNKGFFYKKLLKIY